MRVGYDYYITIYHNYIIIDYYYYHGTLELGGGTACIGWDGKILRVGGGLIPDDEFSVETHIWIEFSIINYK